MSDKFISFIAVILFVGLSLSGCGSSPSELVDRLDKIVNQACVGQQNMSDSQMMQIVGKYNGLVAGINRSNKKIPQHKLAEASSSCDRFRNLLADRKISATLVVLRTDPLDLSADRTEVIGNGRAPVLQDSGRQKSESKRNGGVRSSGKILGGEEIFNKYNSAVFMIFNSDGISGCQGSGFFISSDGLAVSNYHVFKGYTKGAEVIKLSDGSTYKIREVVGHGNMDSEGGDYNDYFVFRVDLNGMRVNYIPIAKELAKVGQKAYAIGSPLGLENTFSSGEISQIRDMDGHKIYQISVPIDHGSSGGVLLNQYGEAIGITSAGMESAANLNFAIDIHEIDYLLK